MKKILALSAIALVFALLFSFSVSAAEEDYIFSLTAEEKEFLEVTHGQTVTVVLTLQRKGDAPYSMHAMQSELRYDPTFLEFVPGSILYTGVQEADVALQDGRREHYVNFLSFTGGTSWAAKTTVATVKFKVIGTSGVSKIENRDFLVSLPDGSGSYPCVSNALTLMLSTDCSVTFHSRGGSEVPPQTVQYGEKILKPQDPVREGYTFAGWYRDILCTEPWDFETDTVDENMSLFAKWTVGNPPAPLTDGPQLPWWIFAVIGLGIVLFLLFFIFLLILLLKRKKKKEDEGEG